MKLVGIDVSKWQGKIDWAKVKNYGIDFAMVRVGTGISSLNADNTALYNIAECNRLGIPVGVYFYSYSYTAEQAAHLALDVMEWIKTNKLQLQYPVAFDIEFDDCHTKAGRAVNTEKCRQVMKVIESYGYYGIIYASESYFRTYLDLSKLQVYDKWIAAYRGVDNIGIPHGMWQYSSMGSIPGINGKVDKDVAYKDYNAIIKRAGLNRIKSDDVYKITADPVSSGDKNTVVDLLKRLKLNYTVTKK